MNVPALAGIDQPFDDQLAHRLLDGHPAGAELRRQRKLVRSGSLAAYCWLIMRFLISRAMVMYFAAIVLPFS
jgi:hypothetical protein